MVYKKRRWTASVFTGDFHYYIISRGRIDDSDEVYQSKCNKSKISETKFELNLRYRLEEIERPDKICKQCLVLTKNKIDIFDHITDLEKEIDDFDDTLCKLLPRLDFFLKIPNIEVNVK